MSLLERRDAAVERRETLRRERAAELLLDGVLSPKLDGDLAVAEREVDAISDAIAEQTRRDRDLREREDERRSHALTSLQAAEARRLDAVGRAEAAARALADALRAALEETGEIEVLLNRLDMRPRPTALALSEMEKRLSARLAAVLTTVGNRPRFGTLPLKSRPGVNLSDDWLEAETCLGVTGLASILNKEANI